MTGRDRRRWSRTLRASTGAAAAFGALVAVLAFLPSAAATHGVTITAPATNSVYAPLATASFTSSVSGTCSGPVYLWTFGDGVGTSVLANPTYAYALGGTYVVNLQVTCLVAHSASASSINVVVDGAAPTLSLPGPITAEATGPSGAAVSFSATATDLVDASPTVVCTPASGSTFALGPTTVNCTATDDVGNQAAGSFTITVRDTTQPTLTLPAPVTAEATGPSGAAVSFSVSATDLVSGGLTPSCAPTSGSTFPLGGTTVNCSVTDGAGNTRLGSFSVTVQDTTAPTLTVPGTQTVEATGPGGATVSFSVSATDLVSGALTPNCAPASGSTFALGTTSVSCSVTDGAGNARAASFNVVVQDTTAPTLGLPGPITMEATSSGGATVTYTVTASDLVSGTVTPACSPSSGSTFPLGTTTVSCSVTDGAGNLGAGSFAGTVSDTTPPTVTTGGDLGRQTSSDSGEAVTFSATAVDVVGGALAPLCAPASGSVFPVGVTTVTCTATDAAANVGTATFTVTLTKNAGLPSSQWYGGAGPDGLGAGGDGGGTPEGEGGGEGEDDGDGDDGDGEGDDDEGTTPSKTKPKTGATGGGPNGGAPGNGDDGDDGDAGGDGGGGSSGTLGELGDRVGEALRNAAGGAPPALAAASSAATAGLMVLATYLRRVWIPVRV